MNSLVSPMEFWLAIKQGLLFLSIPAVWWIILPYLAIYWLYALVLNWAHRQKENEDASGMGYFTAFFQIFILGTSWGFLASFLTSIPLGHGIHFYAPLTLMGSVPLGICIALVIFVISLIPFVGKRITASIGLQTALACVALSF